jgi:hypothetical protein
MIWMTSTARGSGLTEKGKLVGVIVLTSSEATTISLDVTTAGFTQVGGIYYADVIVLGTALNAHSTNVALSWATTASLIQITTAAVLTTAALQVMFVGE